MKRRVEEKLADMEAKIQSLQEMKQALLEFARACGGRGAIGECPLLHALDRADET